MMLTVANIKHVFKANASPNTNVLRTRSVKLVRFALAANVMVVVDVMKTAHLTMNVMPNNAEIHAVFVVLAVSTLNVFHSIIDQNVPVHQL